MADPHDHRDGFRCIATHHAAISVFSDEFRKGEIFRSLTRRKTALPRGPGPVRGTHRAAFAPTDKHCTRGATISVKPGRGLPSESSAEERPCRETSRIEGARKQGVCLWEMFRVVRTVPPRTQVCSLPQCEPRLWNFQCGPDRCANLERSILARRSRLAG